NAARLRAWRKADARHCPIMTQGHGPQGVPRPSATSPPTELLIEPLVVDFAYLDGNTFFRGADRGHRGLDVSQTIDAGIARGLSQDQRRDELFDLVDVSPAVIRDLRLPDIITTFVEPEGLGSTVFAMEHEVDILALMRKAFSAL